MDKIKQAISGKKGLIVYITGGFPNYQECEQAILQAAENGADIIEIGIAFSDPLADGDILQKAGNKALAQGANLEDTLKMIKLLREKTSVPLLIMSYINPIFAYGVEKFADHAQKAGLDGVILPDVPEEERYVVEDIFKKYNLSFIRFIAPTSGSERIASICQKADSGFIYCLARTGVTGTGGGLDYGTSNLLQTAREHAKLPLAIGFGISNSKDAKDAATLADAVIIGSAIVQKLGEGGAEAVGSFVKEIRVSLDS